MNKYDDILIALRRITRAIDLHSKQLVKESGLTAPQLLLMQTLHKHGQMSSGKLAKEVLLTQATVTSILDRLVNNGLVERERSDSDRRVVYTRLTEKGRQRLDDAPELLQSEFTRQFGRLDEWQQNMLLSSLQQVAQMMDAKNLDASPILAVGDIRSQE